MVFIALFVDYDQGYAEQHYFIVKVSCGKIHRLMSRHYIMEIKTTR